MKTSIVMVDAINAQTVWTWCLHAADPGWSLPWILPVCSLCFDDPAYSF